MGEEEKSGDQGKREEEVDAGALFVLKSKGTYYISCGLIIDRRRLYRSQNIK